MIPVIKQSTTKKDIQHLANKLVQQVLKNGNVIEIAEHFAKIETLISDVKDNPDYKAYLIEEVAKYGKECTTPSGTKINLCEVGTKFDYSLTGDIMLIDLELQKAIIDNKIKERQTFLKAIKSPTDVRFGEELITLYPASKTSTSSYKVTIIKS